ncbi:MAG: hypothetical protein DWQ02_05570 [Bacteroidetes bacterium]|nr:MAG: hypothetical protein DWQ02_05570 [Bacteroidota bacterium]
MKKISILLLAGLLLWACKQENSPVEKTDTVLSDKLELSVNQDFKEYENLRVYWVEASDEFISENAIAGDLEVLKTALNQPKFRVSEHKPFGRRDDAGAVNQLTVENKLPNDVFLMSGDVVQGGKQDRAIGEDQIIVANSIKNIPVFCVEQGRWTYQEQYQVSSGPGDRIAAFSGYYNVASKGVRKSIQSGNQNAVWEQVAAVTASNEADSDSKAYAALENSTSFTTSREQYLQELNREITNSNAVGMIIVTGSEVLGVDVFGHPALFQKTYEALLHGYITDVITNGKPLSIKDELIEVQVEKINRKIDGDKSLKYKGAIIHYSDL